MDARDRRFVRSVAPAETLARAGPDRRPVGSIRQPPRTADQDHEHPSLGGRARRHRRRLRPDRPRVRQPQAPDPREPPRAGRWPAGRRADPPRRPGRPAARVSHRRRRSRTAASTTTRCRRPAFPRRRTTRCSAHPCCPTSSAAVPRITRTFRFERGGGGWQVSGQFMDCTRFRFTCQRDAVECCIIGTSSGGRQHPVHIHSEEFRILSPERAAPPPRRRGVRSQGRHAAALQRRDRAAHPGPVHRPATSLFTVTTRFTKTIR